MFITTMYSPSSALRIEPAIEKMKKIGTRSIALIDSTFGAVPKFIKACRKNDIKPIIGLSLNIEGVKTNILCKNEEGYQFLSRNYLKGLTLTELNNENIIVIFNGYKNKEDIERALSLVPSSYAGIFEDNNKEVMEQMGYLWGITNEARRIPFFVANHVDSKEEESLRILTAIKEGTKLLNVPIGMNRGRHIKPFLQTPTLDGSTLEKTYPYLSENYSTVMDSCIDDFSSFGKGRPPSYPFVDRDVSKGIENGVIGFRGNMNENSLFRVSAINGLKQRLKKISPEKHNIYINRLKKEISIIENMNFEGYILIVSDLIKIVKQANIPVGPGRGSAVGSLVLFALGVTEIDPIEFGLLFERFLNPERATMPDVDIDISQKHRQFVLEMIRNSYGLDNVAQIPSFITFKPKAAIEEAVRVLGYKPKLKEVLSKLIGNNFKGLTISEIYKEIPREIDDILYSFKAENLLDTAQKIEGLVDYVGLHASGVIISPQPIHDKSPLMSVHKTKTIHVEGEDAEWFELVKFDLLGLKILSIMEKAINLIESRHGVKIDLNQIDRNNKDVYDFYSKDLFAGIFQLSSKGMRDLVKKIPPKNFNDIIDIIALYRPGVLESSLLKTYINRKNGKEPISYFSKEFEPILKPILEPTFGVIVYQEQVMEIVAQISDSLEKADTVRRAMSKKKSSQLKEMEKDFVQSATNKGYSKKGSEDLFKMIEKFAGYGFNKSHSAAYALISYFSASLKMEYPIEFLTASLHFAEKDEKIEELIYDALKGGIKILPPDINKSQASFSIEDDNIRFGLSSIKGIGAAMAEKIILAREGKYQKEGIVNSLFSSEDDILNSKSSDFSSLADIKKRIGKGIEIGTIKNLIRSGALNNIEKNPEDIMFKISPEEDISGLKGGIIDKMSLERKVFGFPVTDPFEKSKEILSKYKIPTFEEIPMKRDKKEKISPSFIPVFPIKIEEKNTKKGNPMIVLTIMSSFQTEKLYIYNNKQIAKIEEILGRDSTNKLIQKPLIIALLKSQAIDSDQVWTEIDNVEYIKDGKKEWGAGIFSFTEGVLKANLKKNISSSLEIKELELEKIDLSGWNIN